MCTCKCSFFESFYQIKEIPFPSQLLEKEGKSSINIQFTKIWFAPGHFGSHGELVTKKLH